MKKHTIEVFMPDGTEIDQFVYAVYAAMENRVFVAPNYDKFTVSVEEAVTNGVISLILVRRWAEDSKAYKIE